MERTVSETKEGIVNFLSNIKRRQQMKKENRNQRKKNRKPNKLIQSSISNNHQHRFGVKPSIPKTSEELREMNEIKSEDDLYKNIYFLDWTYEGQTIWDEGKGELIPHGYGKEIFTKVTPVVDGVSSQEKELSYEGGFKNNKRDGYGIVTLNTGTTWEGSFKDGLRHGKGYANFKSANNFIPSGKDLIECRDEFENGRSVGSIEYVYESGATSIVSSNQHKELEDSYSKSSQQEKEEFNEFGQLCVL